MGKTAWIFTDGQWIEIGSGINLIWIYVGKTGVNGIDSILATNPHPYRNGDTPGEIPFDNGTTMPTNPLAFAKLKTALFLSGGFTGVTAGLSIFTLPIEFTPAHDQPIHFVWNDFTHLAAANIQADSHVVYVGSSAITFS